MHWCRQHGALPLSNVVVVASGVPLAGCCAAALQGHPRLPDTAVLLTRVDPIGQYALQLKFSDGHDRGIYPWALLHELSLARRRNYAPL